MAAPCAEPQRGVWRQGHSHLAILPKPGLPGPHRRSSLSPQPFSEQDGEATKPTTKTAQGLSPSCRPERGPWPGDTAEGQLGVSGSVSAPSSPPLQDEGAWPTGLSLPQNTSARGGGHPLTLQPGASTHGQGQQAARSPGPHAAHETAARRALGSDREARLRPSAALGLGARLRCPRRTRATPLGLGARLRCPAAPLGPRACLLAPSRAFAEDTLHGGPCLASARLLVPDVLQSHPVVPAPGPSGALHGDLALRDGGPGGRHAWLQVAAES